MPQGSAACLWGRGFGKMSENKCRRILCSLHHLPLLLTFRTCSQFLYVRLLGKASFFRLPKQGPCFHCCLTQFLFWRQRVVRVLNPLTLGQILRAFFLCLLCHKGKKRKDFTLAKRICRFRRVSFQRTETVSCQIIPNGCFLSSYKTRERRKK